MQSNAKTTSATALKKAKAALDSGDDPKRVLEDLAHQITNQLLHQQIMRIKQAVRDGDERLVNTALELYEPMPDKPPCTDQ